MKVGVIGLGLIGGSLARAVKQNTEHTVLGWDISETIRYRAKLVGAVDDFLKEGNPSGCDIVIIALYPEETRQYIADQQKQFGLKSVVVDCCGIKKSICQFANRLAKENGFYFVGGHPMAGIERSGFAFSNPALFEGASMILTPEKDMDLTILNQLSFFFRSLGFGSMTITTPEEHDAMIAYTSQLAHVVSSAYIKEDLSDRHRGFSAGSFQDMTRVAKLNEQMWTELFLDNRTYLLKEVNDLMKRMERYRDAIEKSDAVKLKQILREGREKRQSIEETPEFE